LDGIMTFRIFTNDRGKQKGVPMYSCLTATESDSAMAAEAAYSSPHLSGVYAPVKAIEWPPVLKASKDWLAKHVG
jgi:hypothetical protein